MGKKRERLCLHMGKEEKSVYQLSKIILKFRVQDTRISVCLKGQILSKFSLGQEEEASMALQSCLQAEKRSGLAEGIRSLTIQELFQLLMTAEYQIQQSR